MTLKRTLKWVRHLVHRTSTQRDPGLRVEVRRHADTLVVVGAGDLPDGTIVQVGVWRGAWDGPFDDMQRATATLRDGSCEAESPATRGWSGRVSAVIELHADGSQPKGVQDDIGPRGEALAFADFESAGARHFFATTTTILESPSG